MQENSQFQSENPNFSAWNTAKKEKANAFLLSLGALWISVIITAFFYAMAFFTEANISSKNAEMAEMKNKISQFESDKKNSIAALVADENIFTSIQLKKLLEEFSAVAQKYGVIFQNFSIENDTITTNLTAMNDNKDAAEKIIAMMKEFAKTGQQGSFSLEPIFSISGDRTARTTPVTFKIIKNSSNPNTSSQ